MVSGLCNRAFWGLCCLWLQASCTEVSDTERFPQNPEHLQIVSTAPSSGATGIPSNQDLELCLSDLVDPRSVTNGDVVVRSGRRRFAADVTTQLRPWRRPGGVPVPPDSPEAWCGGSVITASPNEPLTGGVLYRLVLSATVAGWEGEELDTDQDGWLVGESGDLRYFLEFTVSEEEPDPTPQTVTPTLSDLFADGGIFDPAREQCSCHTEPDTLAFALLDLTTPQTASTGLLSDTSQRDTGFPMVSPRLPSQSFLFQKLLREADNAAIGGVLGDPMPPDHALDYDDLVAIALWIEGGASL